MGEQLPSIGRIVNYTNLGDKDGKYPPEIQAAVVTGVYREYTEEREAGKIIGCDPANKVGEKSNCMYVDLKVFYRSGFFDMQRVPFSPEPSRGHWNWPPRT